MLMIWLPTPIFLPPPPPPPPVDVVLERISGPNPTDDCYNVIWADNRAKIRQTKRRHSFYTAGHELSILDYCVGGGIGGRQGSYCQFIFN